MTRRHPRLTLFPYPTLFRSTGHERPASTDRSTAEPLDRRPADRKSTRLNSSHMSISYAVFCLKKKNYAKYGKEILKQPGMLAFQIFDAKVMHLLRDEYRIAQVTKAEAGTLEELAAALEIESH